MRSDYSLGGLLAALSALGYATNPILGKLGYQAGATPITLMTIRFTIAALGLWVWILWRRQAGSVPVRRRLELVALGILGFAVVSLLYFTAVQHVDASLATGLFYTYPAQVALVGLFRGDDLTNLGLLGLVLTVVGTWMLLSTGLGAGFTWGGALMIIASSMLYTAHILVSERLTRGVRPEVATAYVTAGAAAVYLVLTLATGQPLPGTGAFLAGSGLAICSTGLALVTFFAGMARIGPTRASIISTLEPVFTALLAVALLGEHLVGVQMGGIALVVLGAVFAQMRNRAEAGSTLAPAPSDETQMERAAD